MEFLGIGPLELFFVVVIALIVLGPKDMVKAGRTMGRFMRKIVMSPAWRTVQQTSDELRKLPTTLMREAGMEDLKDLKQGLPTARDFKIDDPSSPASRDLSDWTRNLAAQADTPAPVSPDPVEDSPAPPELSDQPLPPVEPEDNHKPKEEGQAN